LRKEKRRCAKSYAKWGDAWGNNIRGFFTLTLRIIIWVICRYIEWKGVCIKLDEANICIQTVIFIPENQYKIDYFNFVQCTNEVYSYFNRPTFIVLISIFSLLFIFEFYNTDSCKFGNTVFQEAKTVLIWTSRKHLVIPF
jgi:hypothetical protein